MSRSLASQTPESTVKHGDSLIDKSWQHLHHANEKAELHQPKIDEIYLSG
jgi:hypothetical protein